MSTCFRSYSLIHLLTLSSIYRCSSYNAVTVTFQEYSALYISRYRRLSHTFESYVSAGFFQLKIKILKIYKKKKIIGKHKYCYVFTFQKHLISWLFSLKNSWLFALFLCPYCSHLMTTTTILTITACVRNNYSPSCLQPKLFC